MLYTSVLTLGVKGFYWDWACKHRSEPIGPIYAFEPLRQKNLGASFSTTILHIFLTMELIVWIAPKSKQFLKNPSKNSLLTIIDECDSQQVCTAPAAHSISLTLPPPNPPLLPPRFLMPPFASWPWLSFCLTVIYLTLLFSFTRSATRGLPPQARGIVFLYDTASPTPTLSSSFWNTYAHTTHTHEFSVCPSEWLCRYAHTSRICLSFYVYMILPISVWVCDTTDDYCHSNTQGIIHRCVYIQAHVCTLEASYPSHS